MDEIEQFKTNQTKLKNVESQLTPHSEWGALLIKKDNLVSEMLSLTKSIKINVEEDIDSYIQMVEKRDIIIEELKLIDKKMAELEEEQGEALEFSELHSTNLTIAKNSSEIIKYESFLLEKIEWLNKDLKKEAKTIVEGKTARNMYQKEFENLSPKIDIKQ
ncbi:MAG: hypothetical protein FWF50_02975 [Defluviitaleaceae bacterium]|nr:hypothetical protein [Defluviitaleaceae bacterium]